MTNNRAQPTVIERVQGFEDDHKLVQYATSHTASAATPSRASPRETARHTPAATPRAGHAPSSLASRSGAAHDAIPTASTSSSDYGLGLGSDGTAPT